MRRTCGRIVTGRLVQGEDGTWREDATIVLHASGGGEAAPVPAALGDRILAAYRSYDSRRGRLFEFEEQGVHLLGSAMRYARHLHEHGESEIPVERLYYTISDAMVAAGHRAFAEHERPEYRGRTGQHKPEEWEARL